MLTDAAIDKQLEEARRQLMAWVNDIVEGELAAMAPVSIRGLADILNCLLDEAPEEQHQEIHFLIDRCDSLAVRTAN